MYSTFNFEGLTMLTSSQERIVNETQYVVQDSEVMFVLVTYKHEYFLPIKLNFSKVH